MKRYSLFSIRLFLAICSFSLFSSYRVSGQLYGKVAASQFFGITASSGFTISHTDFAWTKSESSPVFSLGCHYTPVEYADFCVDFQMGRLKGQGPSVENPESITRFKNDFGAFSFIFRFAPLKLADYNSSAIVELLSNIYFGMGVGLIHSKVNANDVMNPDYGSDPTYHGDDLFVPFEVGIYIPLVKRRTTEFLFNFNVRTNRCFSDNIDGYVPTVEANRHNDAYSSITAGVTYRFGI